jgi:hypothetical protein
MSTKQIIAMSAPVSVTAAVAEGEEKSPAKFTAEFYTGGALEIDGWDLPVVVDLAGLEEGKVLVANLDHDRTKRVGNFAVANDGRSLVANGTASAVNQWSNEVVASAANGYQWQASLEVQPKKGGVETVKAGAEVTVNGQQFTGPLYITRQGVLKGFGFVTHGADDNTSASIAAIAAAQKGKHMDKEFEKWVEAMGFDPNELNETQLAGLKANYDGTKPEKPKPQKGSVADVIAKRKAEEERHQEIAAMADAACEKYPFCIDAIGSLAEQAVEASWKPERFRMELLEATIPTASGPFIQTPKGPDHKVLGKVIEAAICKTGGLKDVEKQFDDQTLQYAHDRFKNGIGLKELIHVAAQANGYRGASNFNIDRDVQAAAFGMNSRGISAAGFSTFSLPNTVANTANKFLREGWNAIDQTPLRIAAIRSVSDFKQITTVSLTGGFQFEKLSPAGEIPHAAPGELTYTNQADTYGIMFAVTRKDYINDDLGALTAVPRKIGRGGMLKLNDIFWTEFLNNSTFFTSGRANVNEAVADITIGGLDATETIFNNQTDADGKPLGAMAQILLVPTALKNKALALMDPQGRVQSGASAGLIDSNVFAGRFRVESSPYMSNTAYTGYSAAAWYMLADPNDIPVIEIAALNGRVEPTVETADTDFNTLGFQMRGYSDVGVNLQEYRGGVRADGGSS